jgi:hypothetical protein
VLRELGGEGVTNRQKQKAAKLWSLALVIHGSEQVEETEEENTIRVIAGEAATKKLHRMGYDAGKLSTMKDCIDAVYL